MELLPNIRVKELPGSFFLLTLAAFGLGKTSKCSRTSCNKKPSYNENVTKLILES